ncbi:MAG: SUMF1/EgtB/PvdO family nonheme iron enzyme [Candidatus Hinthialibacter antarcticus]|nr:SUMF1/EgtB/PvdO family nonheme iron enzyme [Candidatus Hinthialibacter antarcticus]
MYICNYLKARNAHCYLLFLISSIMLCTQSVEGQNLKEYIFFSVYNNGVYDSIWRMNPDGTNKQIVFEEPGVKIFFYNISPDGEKIVIAKETELWTYDIDGTNPQLIDTTDSLPFLSPRWSPDSQKILYVIGSSGSNRKFSLINADGTNKVMTSVFGHRQSFTRDGNHVIYLGPTNSNSNNYDIWICDYDGTTLSNAVNLSPGSPYESTSTKGQAISADGVVLDYLWPSNTIATRQLIENNGVFSLGPRINLFGATTYDASWSYNDQKIVLNRGYDIFIANPDGSGLVNLTNSPERENGALYVLTKNLDLDQENNEPIIIDIPNLPANAKPLEMVKIPAGTFMMGSPEDELDRNASRESPLHNVTISQDFYMGIYEITQAQWEAVMGNNPSINGGNPNHPVENISWNDSQEFIENLNEFGQGTFRLPTEAEWEYACRAGTTTRYYWGDDLTYSEINDYAWFSGNASIPQVVGIKIPNSYGLYDMAGNITEWCIDGLQAYLDGDQIDPVQDLSGTVPCVRGGSIKSLAEYCRSAQ